MCVFMQKSFIVLAIKKIMSIDGVKLCTRGFLSLAFSRTAHRAKLGYVEIRLGMSLDFRWAVIF